MPRPYGMPVWKKAPFIRLLLPLIAGIILQWYVQIPVPVIAGALISFSIAFLLFLLLPIALRFKLQFLQGFIIHLLLIGFGLLLTWQKDNRHNNNWYGNYYKDSSYLIVRINEPLVEKNKSFKADGYVESVLQNDTAIPCKGKLLLYFSKDSSIKRLHYGDKILIRKNLQSIKNSGNPGAFNYQRYAAFQGIFHNVFLKEKDWTTLPNAESGKNRFKQFIFSAREKVLATLRKNINAGKDELGIAEALLIGYTNDLDKDLVQAYSNTGVVHIIAISGMHLGLIYIMLVWLFARIPYLKKSKWIQAFLILTCLWLFSLLTGGAASVIRSAVMFTFITLGKTIFTKQSSIFSSLAASAFLMLCYNPYYLWDVGFQLSYLAVTGIIIFQRPIYNCLYIKNKWINKVWQLMAISLAAQLLTFPVCIYYFHQFPNLFLISNIIAVPLSGFILYAEIALVGLSWIPFIGIYLGKLVGTSVWIMNKVILWINELSFAVWDKIHATVFSTWLLYAVVIGLSAWLIRKNKRYFKFGILCLFAFVVLQTYNSWQMMKQQKIIVYNVPQHQAIDFVSGNNYRFIGDSILLEEGLLQNFHLKPGRIALQLDNRVDSLNGIFQDKIFYQFQNKRIVIINKPVIIDIPQQKINVDLVIISKNPRLYISQLTEIFNCNQFIFDASNPVWKIEKWKKECNDLQLPNHSVPGEGAFVYDIGM
jgi:competence protein ComEC